MVDYEERLRELKGIEWIGVDLDGTMAFYDHWRGHKHIGVPLMPMVNRVRQFIADGHDVRVLTARVISEYAYHVTAGGKEKQIERETREAIRAWCVEHIGKALPITCEKRHDMMFFFDDRCVQMVPNTGDTLFESHAAAEKVAAHGKP